MSREGYDNMLEATHIPLANWENENEAEILPREANELSIIPDGYVYKIIGLK